ncbi:MAG: VTT domain-containing protein [candidate division FCPU426 bacterium]
MELLHQLLWYIKPEGISHLIHAFGLPGICLILFAETGFFALLPGDSLLVLCGIFAATPDPTTGQPLLPLWALLVLAPLSGVLGDQVGYWLGSLLGKSVYGWNDFKLLGVPVYKRAYLQKTEQFYSRWGSFTVVAGRWVPVVRTFAPIVAGVTRMPFKTFLPYNIIGAFSWVWSMVFAGYFLDSVLTRLFPGFVLAAQIDKIAGIIILISLAPIAYTLWKERGQPAEKRPERRVMERRHAKGRRKK